MILQIIGLWAIVALGVGWFIRDEQRRRDMRERFAVMAHFTPRLRPEPRSAAPVPPSPLRQPVLSTDALKLVARLGQLHRES